MRSQIDLDLAARYEGTESLPFTRGDQVAVKVIDHRGIETMRVWK